MPTDLSALRIERFDPAQHDRKDFACGVARLDNYLKLTAKKQQRDDMSRVYVAVRTQKVAHTAYSSYHGSNE